MSEPARETAATPAERELPAGWSPALRWRDVARRSRAVVTILARHGLGSLVRELRLRRWPLPRRRAAATVADPTPAARLRLALEEMGATFVKLGQIASTREDLLPPALIAELTRLQEEAPAAPWPAVRAQIERELGRPLEQAFAELDPVPLAAASLGQVHAGVLPGGARVAVKVLRPGVERQVDVDLAVMARIGALAARNPALAPWEPERFVEEMARTLRGELDYHRERRNLERFGRLLADIDGVRVPAVHPAWCTRRVLTMERIDGVRVDDVAALRTTGVDGGTLARRMSEVLFRSALQHGFFHADPHPGNYRVLPDGTLVMLDFGMMAQLGARERDAVLELLLALVAGDADGCTDRLAELGLHGGPGTQAALRREIAHLLADYGDLPFGELPMGEVLGRVLGAIRALRLALPPDLAMLVKTVVMAEGLGVRLDPSFQLVPVARPLVRDALRARLRPPGGDRLRQAALDAASLTRELPARLRRLGDRLDRGGLQVDVRIDPRAFVHELERLVRNLRVSVLAAAGIVAMGLLTLAHPPPGIRLWAPWLFVGGGGALAVLLAWLLLDSWRSRRL